MQASCVSLGKLSQSGRLFFAWAYAYIWAPSQVDGGVLQGMLPDTDSYMRLIRVEALYMGGGWYDHLVAAFNAPFMGDLHWTRPLDILIILLAAPLDLFLETKQAIFWAGALVCPLLLLASLWLTAWAIKPLVRPGNWLLPVLMLALQTSILGYGQVDEKQQKNLWHDKWVPSFDGFLREMEVFP